MPAIATRKTPWLRDARLCEPLVAAEPDGSLAAATRLPTSFSVPTTFGAFDGASVDTTTAEGATDGMFSAPTEDEENISSFENSSEDGGSVVSKADALYYQIYLGKRFETEDEENISSFENSSEDGGLVASKADACIMGSVLETDRIEEGARSGRTWDSETASRKGFPSASAWSGGGWATGSPDWASVVAKVRRSAMTSAAIPLDQETERLTRTVVAAAPQQISLRRVAKKQLVAPFSPGAANAVVAVVPYFESVMPIASLGTVDGDGYRLGDGISGERFEPGQGEDRAVVVVFYLERHLVGVIVEDESEREVLIRGVSHVEAVADGSSRDAGESRLHHQYLLVGLYGVLEHDEPS
eukprot:CAMPEP_0172577094 /NCGR_PEP_ID=MMETSP1067-20121228/138058_1 /TAXON_ID=265564 ORGANISM="Thalassiosira punctigera, Strain Tpunct2005C2" /NCGR_SAMPLE_ID=MMETSP1067 /ASSEMBLY_ACC=CAM_ASM_000444 /LENGTH=355 /DNA_ID=CAMNT_0013369777 /DNA_START=1152 /DNA_END=2216 /DNA_ORIENTATION=-